MEDDIAPLTEAQVELDYLHPIAYCGIFRAYIIVTIIFSTLEALRIVALYPNTT
jgi:hypothetical protein